MPRIEIPYSYVGIDPGVSGGIAVVWSDGLVDSLPMPVTEREVWHCFRSMAPRTPPLQHNLFAVIEKVSGFAGDRGSGSNGPAMFKFGQSYGGLRMALVAAGIPFEEVTPQTWQKAMGVPSRKKEETRVQFKNRLKGRASQLFPNEKVTLATCDALLIAEYCKRKRTGTL